MCQSIRSSLFKELYSIFSKIAKLFHPVNAATTKIYNIFNNNINVNIKGICKQRCQIIINTFIYLSIYLLVFRDRVSLRSPSWKIYSVDQGWL